jgi:hypothetical protein
MMAIIVAAVAIIAVRYSDFTEDPKTGARPAPAAVAAAGGGRGVDSTGSSSSSSNRSPLRGLAAATQAAMADPRWTCSICKSALRLRSRHLGQLRDERACGQCARKILRAAQLLYVVGWWWW